MSLGIGSGFADMNGNYKLWDYRKIKSFHIIDADNSTLCAMNITLSDGSTGIFSIHILVIESCIYQYDTL